MNEHLKFRPEIQGLRAVAVLSVLAFHLWPSAVPGGYVGVDIFFVISGYLITGLLLKEYEAEGRISVSRFYLRRIRRLLPAASVVLLAVAACASLLPVVRWGDTATDIAASALYFQNWWLAHQAVDYLASDQAPSVLQHFWSLSVEEQYYIVWPLLILAATHLTAWTARNARLAFGIFVVVIGLVSLTYSIYLTPRSPGLAYFATTTRAWELALGGTLAVFPQWRLWSPRVRGACGLLGTALIIVSLARFTTATPFPGYSALVPTIGAALVIMIDQSRTNLGTYALLSSAPLRYVGDLSYSLYLWHWPVIVFYGLVSGRPIGVVDGMIIAFISCALAHQSKDLIEDRFRERPSGGKEGLRTFLFGAGCICATLIASAAIIHASHSEGRAVESSEEFRPSLVDARKDVPDVYITGCHANQGTEQPKNCSWGPSESPAMQVVVVGDSHAAQWLPALREIGEKRRWRLTSFTKSACALVDTELSLGKDKRPYDSCRAWGKNVTRDIIRMKPDLIITTQSRGQHAYGSSTRSASDKLIVDGLLRSWASFHKARIQVIALRDTPRVGVDIPECMASRKGSIKSCSRPRLKALAASDAVVMAAAKDKDVTLIDMSKFICGSSVCSPVLNHMLVWRDSHHLTATYAKALAPKLESRLMKAIQSHDKSN